MQFDAQSPRPRVSNSDDLFQAKASLRRKIRQVRNSAYGKSPVPDSIARESENLTRLLTQLLKPILSQNDRLDIDDETTRQVSVSGRRAVAAYVPTALEPNLVPFLEILAQPASKVNLFVPRFRSDSDLEWVRYAPGDYLIAPDRVGFGPANSGHALGTAELPPLDAILIPALAGTMQGARLGQGGGYYDRVLKLIPRCPRIMVLHPHEIFRDLPVGAHDEPVDIIVTAASVCYTDAEAAAGHPDSAGNA